MPGLCGRVAREDVATWRQAGEVHLENDAESMKTVLSSHDLHPVDHVREAREVGLVGRGMGGICWKCCGMYLSIALR